MDNLDLGKDLFMMIQLAITSFTMIQNISLLLEKCSNLPTLDKCRWVVDSELGSGWIWVGEAPWHEC